jgi:hypothetical protein
MGKQPTRSSHGSRTNQLLLGGIVLEFELALALEDDIGSQRCVTSSVRWQSSWLEVCTRGCHWTPHACWLEANMRVTIIMPLGRPIVYRLTF